MSSSALDYFPGELEIKTSPLAFAIIGPKGRHRGILVRSSQPCLDLVGLDHSDAEVPKLRSAVWEVFQTQIPLSIVRSSLPIPANFLQQMAGPESFPDRRHSTLSFAWRGSATTDNLESLEGRFTGISVDLVAALERGDIMEVEWLIAPLILQCSVFHERRVSSVVLRRLTFGLAGIIYVLFATLLAAKFFPGRF